MSYGHFPGSFRTFADSSLIMNAVSSIGCSENVQAMFSLCAVYPLCLHMWNITNQILGLLVQSLQTRQRE